MTSSASNIPAFPTGAGVPAEETLPHSNAQGILSLGSCDAKRTHSTQLPLERHGPRAWAAVYVFPPVQSRRHVGFY